MDKHSYHTPVLLNECLEQLNIKPDGFYIDCTLGEGGHSSEIANKLGANGMLLSLDQDSEAVEFVKSRYAELFQVRNWKVEQSNFSKIVAVLEKYDRKPDGILMDIGISSRQLEGVKRGFSYRSEDEELDMRMDEQLGVKASDLLKVLNEYELSRLFRIYGEERFARQIANAIKSSKREIRTVGELNSLIYRVIPAKLRDNSKHPARRVFQALRIAVNDELNALKDTVRDGFQVLKPGGRILIITFHSLEDRNVKSYFEQLVKNGSARYLNEQVVLPSDKELSDNPRAHSAKLRSIEKI